MYDVPCSFPSMCNSFLFSSSLLLFSSAALAAYSDANIFLLYSVFSTFNSNFLDLYYRSRSNNFSSIRLCWRWWNSVMFWFLVFTIQNLISRIKEQVRCPIQFQFRSKIMKLFCWNCDRMQRDVLTLHKLDRTKHTLLRNY